MPAVEDGRLVAERTVQEAVSLARRINIPTNSLSPPGLIEAETRDPWSKSGKYALGWLYFCIILLVFTMVMRFYHLWTDKIRTALHSPESVRPPSPDIDYEMTNLDTNDTVAKMFPRQPEKQIEERQEQSSVSSVRPFNLMMSYFRFVFYRPVPVLRWRKHALTFPSFSVIAIVSIATIFVTLYCFVPQPLYWSSIQYGSPPLSIRAGMLAISMVPWIIATSMKANLITLVTGLGHERLGVLHRWGGYLCLFLALIHTVPFYKQPVWDQGGMQVFKSYFSQNGTVIYGNGIAALVPLIWLCVLSLPAIRDAMYELFVALHVPVSIIFTAMLFWHTHNYLTSWSYLYATVAIWFVCYIYRLFKLNWTNPWKMSWLIGDECGVTILNESAVKVTIPTQMKWRPGQYVYLRMPAISVFDNHPFTIASLYSDDFPSEFGEAYKDMTLVFRPFGGFTRKVLNTAIEKGPYKTYRAFIDGPYGGMNRRLEAFDSVVMIGGGSGITALVSQLLELVKRMRDGKAVTKTVHVVWSVKRLESVEWFKEELRICREYSPPDSVFCQFFITASKRQSQMPMALTPTRPISGLFHDKLNNFAQGVASKRSSAYIRDEAGGDLEREKELRAENQDTIAALPQPKPPQPAHTRQKPSLSLQISNHRAIPPPPPIRTDLPIPQPPTQPPAFEFGFPSTPTLFQKNLMRFAFGPAVKKNEGWSTEYGRPDIPYMLRDFSKDFGRRTAIFVCGPPGMREDVQRTVASLQRDIWGNSNKDEIFLHTENYAI